MKIVSVVGAYPDVVQASLLSRLLRPHHTEIVIYPGRRSDFYDARGDTARLDIVQPHVSLDIDVDDWEQSFANLVLRLERALIERRPDLVIVRGEGPATLAGALTAARLHIPLARIDGGRRAYVKHAPNEVSRLIADRLADWIFCGSEAASQRLAAEGLSHGVIVSGDGLLDVAQHYLPLARMHSTLLTRIGLHPGVYLMAMVGSAETLDNPVRLRGIVSALNAIREPIVLPCPPRLRQAIEQLGMTLVAHILPIEPVGYLDRLMLTSQARAIITDLDEIQREAYGVAVPCITVRETTESPETVDTGWNQLVGTQPDRLISVVRDFEPPHDHPPVLGDGHAIERIAAVLNVSPIEFGANYGTLQPSLSALPLAV